MTPGAARCAATHGCRTHVVFGLKVGAPVQQQLHHGRVATPCCCSKSRCAVLRRRVAARHRTHRQVLRPLWSPSRSTPPTVSRVVSGAATQLVQAGDLTGCMATHAPGSERGACLQSQGSQQQGFSSQRARPHRGAYMPRRCPRPSPPPRARLPLHFHPLRGWPCCQMCWVAGERWPGRAERCEARLGIFCDWKLCLVNSRRVGRDAASTGPFLAKGTQHQAHPTQGKP